MADEFSDKLNAVLGNPEAMGQIMSIARALTGESGDTPPPPQEPEPQAVPTPVTPALPPVPPAAPTSAAAPPDLSGLMSLLGSLTGGSQTAPPSAAPAANPLSALGDLDPRLIQTGIRLLSEYNNTDDRKTALLTALRPFVKEERFAKVDRAIQIGKLSRVIRIALHVLKDSGGGDEHV